MIFSTLFYFVLALFLLVTIHEFGHFIVARAFGVKVLRFSFGFGKILWQGHDKRGTEYAFSLLPLGGYVKMLDSTESPVLAHERSHAFDFQPVWKRFLIVLAGPVFNFVFALITLWIIGMVGSHNLAPIIANVIHPSIAAQAGLQKNVEIVSIDGKPVNSWRDVQYALISYAGSDETIQFKVRSLSNGAEQIIPLSLTDWVIDKKANLLTDIGILPFIPKIPPIIGTIVDPSAALSAGFVVGDKLQAINNKFYDDWIDIVDWVKKNPGKRVTIQVLRNNKIIELPVTIGQMSEGTQTIGFLGMRSAPVDWPKKWVRYDRENPVNALVTAFNQTQSLTHSTLLLMGRFFTGKLPLESLSGPIGIAEGAGASGRSSTVDYLFFLALVSISLGILNILPLPMLDGGHLLYFIIEFIRGKPLNERVKTWGAYLGTMVIVAVTIIAVKNDLSRIFLS